jgi:type IV secretory pathway component VirB8
VRTEGDVRNAFNYIKVVSASSIQANFSESFNNLKKGRPFYPNREMKQLRAAIQLVSF